MKKLTARNRRGNPIDRRQLLKLGVMAGGSVFLVGQRSSGSGRRRGSGSGSGSGSDSGSGSGSGASTPRSLYDPARDAFQRDLFLPEVLEEFPLTPAPGGAVARPRPPRGVFDDVSHGIAPEFDGFGGALHSDDWNHVSSRTHEREYKLITEQTTQQILPGVETPVLTYRDANRPIGSGRTPGPTIVARFREPAVLRSENHLTRDRVTFDHDIETSIHWHGGHAPSHADGYPNFYVLAGEARDYFFPNIAPRANHSRADGPFDASWFPSTTWYHDHAMDITGFTVANGLAGFYLNCDDVESQLIEDNVLPAFGGPQDVGLALQDQRFNADGTLHYDFLDHNGRLGDVFTVNGIAQPVFRVERRKYRFRILNASNSRFYHLRLSSGQPMLVIGCDSWMLPFAHPVESFDLAMGERHDVIVDFRNAPDEVYLENLMEQDDGRKGEGVDPDARTLLMKFIVEGAPVANDITIEPGTALRPHVPIRPEEIQRTREFRFVRRQGAWQVNNRFFNPRRADAVPELGVAERWIFDGGGGWWHPIDLHLVGFQVQSIDGEPPPVQRRFNCGLVNLEGDEIEVFVRFTTFTGPFVFHCHTVEHEDMRMMGVTDPRPAGETTRLDGVTRIDRNVSGVYPDCIELEEEGRIFFDAVGDVDRLEGRGVGFPECEFEADD